MYSQYKRVLSLNSAMLALMAFCTYFMCGAAQAEISEKDRRIALPDSIYTTLSDQDSLDRDKDGLKDDYENRLADAWRPHFIFDEKENSRSNINDISLQPFEPVVIFQVRPIGGSAWPRRIQIKWGFLWRLDGGFRASNFCTDYHYGDTQGGTYELISQDGVNWYLDWLELWNSGRENAKSLTINWTKPRSTYWNKMEQRPSPIIYASAGKHHQYINGGECESRRFCDDDCGGGIERTANLTPLGKFNNVGEPNNHNDPFISELAPLGYPQEWVWFAKWKCGCGSDTKQDCFTGGVGASFKTSNKPQCTVPSATYTLFVRDDPPVPPKEVGLLYTVIPTCL